MSRMSEPQDRHCATCHERMQNFLVPCSFNSGAMTIWRCMNYDCPCCKRVPVTIPTYTWKELFPRRSLDWHDDEDDPGFEDVVKAYEEDR